jgi:sugar phosphate isomerase/epimerase
MKKLLSFIASDSYLDQVGDGWNELDKILQEYKLDGIETMTGGFYKPENIEKVKTIGHHLLYFPSWIHMWLEDEDELIKEFESLEEAIEVYGEWGRQRLIDFYKEEFLDSIKMESEYMVFHVAHVGLDEVFSDNFKYGNKKVLDYTAELLNEIFKDVKDGPVLLLENLWWPGMDLLNEKEAKEFLDQINYPNKGIMLDIYHLTLTDKNIKNFEGVERYIEKLI